MKYVLFILSPTYLLSRVLLLYYPFILMIIIILYYNHYYTRAWRGVLLVSCSVALGLSLSGQTGAAVLLSLRSPGNRRTVELR